MDLATELNTLCQRAEELIQRAEHLRMSTRVAGVGKVKKKIQAELNFIKSLQAGEIVPKKNQLRSTNLSHLDALLHTAETFGQVTALLQPVHYETNDGHDSCLVVDVVGHNGRAWVKVTARKAEALQRMWQGEGEYGEHDIVQQAEQYRNASHQNPIDFSPPTVHVAFFSGITQDVADELLGFGAVVHGHIFNCKDDIKNVKPELPVFQSREGNIESPLESEQRAVNLDVTTMIGLVSDLCHGGSSYSFSEPLIEELSQQERNRPLLPELENFLKGKKMVACETAVKDFKAILETIAGSKEKQRAKELLQRLSIVPDQLSDRTVTLSPSNKIKKRARIIFGTGDALKITTTTANEAFVRAASKQGVNYSVFVHQSRALTEKKQVSPAKATNNSTDDVEQRVELVSGSIYSPVDQLEMALEIKMKQIFIHANAPAHYSHSSPCSISGKMSQLPSQNNVVDVK